MPTEYELIAEALFNEELTIKDLMERDDYYELPFIFGSENKDVLEGTDVMDWVFAGEGNDTVYAGEGDDLVKGERGSDTIYGGGGNDRLDGGNDGDIIFGDEGDDTIWGGEGQDHLSGGDGDDTIYGDTPDSGVAFGASFDDFISGGAGADQIFGGIGDDYISGGEGEDVIQGGEGDDILYGQSYVDPELPVPVPEADVFVYSEISWGDDTIMDFDDGLDLLDFSAHSLVTGIDDFILTQVGNNTVIAYEPNVSFGNSTPPPSSITLVGIDISDVAPDDFIF